jgi:hypothetical protein
MFGCVASISYSIGYNRVPGSNDCVARQQIGIGVQIFFHSAVGYFLVKQVMNEFGSVAYRTNITYLTGKGLTNNFADVFVR